MAKQIVFDEESRQSLKINTLADAVRITLGEA